MRDQHLVGNNNLKSNLQYNWVVSFWVFNICVLIISVAWMIDTPLFDEDEGFYAEASRIMMVSSEWLTTNVLGENRYDKPPFYMWLSIASMYIFGQNECALRLPAFLFFIGTLGLLLTYSSNINYRQNLVLIYCCSFQIQILSKVALVDMPLIFFITLSLTIYKKLVTKKYLKPIQKLTFFVALSLAFLCKGPIGLIIVSAVIIINSMVQKDISFLKLIDQLGLSVLIVVIGIYLYLLFQKSGNEGFAGFFIKHNFGRFSKTMEGHGGWIWYYVPVLIISMLPFLDKLWQVLRYPSLDKKDILLFIWFAFVFVFFSFSATQLPHYLTLGLPPLLLLMARKEFTDAYATKIQIFLTLALLTTAPILIPNFKITDKYVSALLHDLPLYFNQSYYIIILSCILALFILKNRNYIVLCFVTCISLFSNRYAHLQQGFVKSIAKNEKYSSRTISTLDHYNPSFAFYRKGNVNIHENFDAGLYLIKSNKFQKSKMNVLEQGGGMLLVEVHKLK
jgi:4-amino-4-deoxy-L-arabinose transferase-like glycosyltransferase